MGKVKLTQKQADLIKSIKDTDYAINIHGFNKRPDSPLQELTTAELARALYIGYEVEEMFKVGDFVDISLFGISKIAEITGVKGNAIAINGSEEYHKFKINRVLTDEEKQEEKQRRWWAKHGRKVWELKEGDLLISKHDRHSCQVKFVEAADEKTVLLVDGIEDEFYEGKHDLQIMQDRYKVFCFAEDRKDV